MIQYIRRLALCCALLASLSLAACGGNQPVADSGMARYAEQGLLSANLTRGRH